MGSKDGELLATVGNGTVVPNSAGSTSLPRTDERVVVGDRQVLERSAEGHEQIAECLLNDDLEGAIRALKGNWDSGMHRILERLERS